MNGTPWRNEPACRTQGHPSDWDDTIDRPEHLPRETEREQTVRHARAKKVCASCPAREECQSRVDLRTDSGVWFGVHLERWREDQEALRSQGFGFRVLYTEESA